MRETNVGCRSDASAALILMEEAIELLDRSECALDAAAHLDLAICSLRDGLSAPVLRKRPFERS